MTGPKKLSNNCQTMADSSSISHPTPECDKRYLENWQKWLQERERLQSYLGKRLKHHPGELLMNAGDELRLVNEEKSLIHYTRILTKWDHWRGNPVFWKLPLELFNKCDPGGRSFLFKQMTKEEMGEVPTLERVGVPQRILMEKHIVPRTRNVYRKWINSEFRKNKIKSLAEKLEKLQPHRPDYDELIIVGQSSSGKRKEEKPVQEVVEISPPKQTEHFLHKPEQLSLIVDDYEFNACESFSGTKIFLLAFEECDIKSRKLKEKYLSLENRSSVPLKLSWKKIQPYNLFHDLIPERLKTMVFFFEQDDLILLPEQKLDFLFMFRSSESGSYSESWELRVRPALWKEPSKVVVKLKGAADIGNIKEKCDEVLSSLENDARETLIRDTLSKILNRVQIRDDFIPVLHFYDRESLFETMNSNLTAYNDHPKYKYNEIVIKRFEALYQTVKRETDPYEWNYSIHDLRLMVLQHDLSSTDDDSKMQELDDIISHLQSPCEWSCMNTNTYTTFFNQLSSCFAKIDEEVGKLEEDLGVSFQIKQPRLSVENASLSSEIKSDIADRKGKRGSKGSSSQKLGRNPSSSIKRKKSKAKGGDNLEVLQEQPSVEIAEPRGLPESLLAQYKHNLYVIFYSNLCSAVDAIECALQKTEEAMQHRNVKRLEECKAFESKYYRNSKVDLSALVSEILHSDIDQHTEKPVKEKGTALDIKNETTIGIYKTYSSKLKPISYPEKIFYEDTLSHRIEKVVPMVVRSTSTLEGRQLDPEWQDFKEIGAQTSEQSQEFDLVQNVEVLEEKTFLQNVEFSRAVACQKNEDEHVSDEEYFYPSDDVSSTLHS